MNRNKSRSRNKKDQKAKKRIVLPKSLERKIIGILIFLIGVILVLSLFDKAGKGGVVIKNALNLLFGGAVLLVPLFFFVLPFVFFRRKRIKSFNDFTIVITSLSFILLVSGLLATLGLQEKEPANEGKLGLLLVYFPLNFFGSLVTQIMLGVLIFVDLLIFYQVAKDLLPEKTLLPKVKQVEPVKEHELPKKIIEVPGPLFGLPRQKKPEKKELEKAIPVEVEKDFSQPAAIEYKSPPLNLLEKDKGGAFGGDLRENSQVIKETLQNFGIDVRMGEINVGPTVTQYTLEPAPGIKLSRITGLGNNLALALAAHPIRIEAPIPGKSLVGIEVPNKKRAFVRLRELIADQAFQEASSSLVFALGQDVSGSNIIADLTRMPHLLVAGSTGTGKTVCLNSIIMSFLYKNSPKTLRFILVDPKRVEFTAYNNLPHLLCPVIYDAEKTVGVLNWLTSEMERRFKVLAKTEVKNIATYNALLSEEGNNSASAKSSGKDEGWKDSIMPYIVVIIDELADLMAARGRDVEAAIVRLAQMARAVGIHLIVATQRPSVEVLTGLIKANITSRISFQVATQVDARTVLDTAGPEKLLGLGDLLFISSETSKPKRVQGVFASSKEVERVVSWIRENQGTFEENEPGLEIEAEAGGEEGGLFYSGSDPLFEKAKDIVVRYKKGSASLIQRKLRVGYARAARLLDLLEKEGIVGPPEGSKARKVYVDEYVEDKYADEDEDESDGDGTEEYVDEDIEEEEDF